MGAPPGPSSVGDRAFAAPPRLVLLGLLSLFWGATFPMIRLGVGSGASPLLLVAIVLGIAAGPMAVVAWARNAPRPPLRAFASSALVGTVLVGGTNVFLYWGTQFASGGIAAIVFAMTPILAHFVLRGTRQGAPLTPLAALSLGLGLAGVFVLAYASVGTAMLTSGWGIVALFGGAAFQAVGAVLVGRLRPAGETLYGQAGQFVGGAAVAGVGLLVLGSPLVLPITPSVVASVLYVALLTTVVGYTIYFELLRTSGPVGANLVTYLNPLVALAVGVAFLRESFGLAEGGGLALVLLALLLFGRAGHGKPARPAAAPDAGGPPTASGPGAAPRGL